MHSMISKDDIKKLADLARIEIKEEEQEQLATQIDAILAYVGQVSAVAKAMADEKRSGVDVGEVRNIMREDTNPNEPGTYSKELIAEFPESENSYLKVKKIL